MRLPSFTVLLATILLTACVTQAEVTESGAEFKVSGSNMSSAAPLMTKVTEQFQSGGILLMGQKNAPVSMILFVNHASPYSQQFHTTLLPRLIEDFVSKNTLQIGIVPVALAKYPQSDSTASMLICATLQGKGQAMNDLLFSKANPATLQKQIADIGMVPATLQDCLKGTQVQTALAEEKALAASFNVTLVPSYVINDTLSVGLPEYADLRGQINAALAD